MKELSYQCASKQNWKSDKTIEFVDSFFDWLVPNEIVINSKNTVIPKESYSSLWNTYYVSRKRWGEDHYSKIVKSDLLLIAVTLCDILSRWIGCKVIEFYVFLIISKTGWQLSDFINDNLRKHVACKSQQNSIFAQTSTNERTSKFCEINLPFHSLFILSRSTEQSLAIKIEQYVGWEQKYFWSQWHMRLLNLKNIP